MGIFYIFFTLFPCVMGQLQERWLGYVAKKWIGRNATVIQQKLGGVWAPTVEILYRFDMNGESHEGKFQRRYQNKTSAGNVPVYEPGAGLKSWSIPKIQIGRIFLFLSARGGFSTLPQSPYWRLWPL